MLLIYYYTKDGIKGWKMAEKKEVIEQFIKENDIEDYGITVNESEYTRLNNHVESLKETIDTIKTSIKEIIKD